MTSLDGFANTWGPLARTITWQLAALAVLIWVCEWALRLRQARVRHTLWWCVLLAPLALAPARLALERREALVAVPAPTPVVRAVALTQSIDPLPTLRRVPPRPEASPRPAPAVAPRPAPSRGIDLSWPAMLMMAWLLGCGAAGARLMLGHRSLLRMIAASRPVTDIAALEALDALAREAGVRREMVLRVSQAIGAPLLYGIKRPVILMPEEWLRSLSPEDLRVVLAHEVAHVKRGDFLGNLVQRLAELPLFFHPATWLAGRRIALAREELCDAAALAPGADPRTYALSLLAAAQKTRARLAMASVGVAEGKFTLLRRVEAIMRTGGMKRVNRTMAAGLAVVLVAAVAVLAVAEVREGKGAEPKAMFSACTAGHPAGPGLFVADSDLANPIRLTTPQPELPNAEGGSPGSASGCDIGAWSPDGTRVAVSRNMFLYVLDLQALIEHPDQEPMPLRDEAGELISAGNPCWSPDGERIAFHDGDGVAIVNPDGTGYRLLARVQIRPREPEWSPDGGAIVFRSGMEGHSHLSLVTQIDGPGEPEVRQLTADPDWRECWAHWSPDGRMLVFTRTAAGDSSQVGDVWVIDVATGEEMQLTDSPSILERTVGWSPFDGKLYYTESGPDPADGARLVRMEADGTRVERFQRAVMPGGRLTWARAGAWIEGVNALPGERVVAKLGLQDSEALVEAAADIGYTGGSNTVEPLDVARGSSIRNWVMGQPQAGEGVLSVDAHARNPDAQAVSGPAHLFDLEFGNTSAAQPDELQPLDFEDLHLEDRWGGQVPGPALAGGVRTIPFAALDLSIGSRRVHRDGSIGLWVTVRALDRDGEAMADCHNPVCLGTYLFEPDKYWVKENEVLPARPDTVTLRHGVWSGRVTVAAPEPGAPLIAYWGDIAAYSDPLIPKQEGQGDPRRVSGVGGAQVAWLEEPARTEALEVLTNMKQVALAVMMFLADQNQVLPRTNDTGEVMEILRPYLKSETVFMRPGTEEPVVEFRFEPGASKHALKSPAESLLAVVDYHPEWRAAAYLDGLARLEPKGAAVARAGADGGGGGGAPGDQPQLPVEVRRMRGNMQRLGLAMRRYLDEHGGIFPPGRDADQLLEALAPYLAPEQLLVHAASGEPLDVRYLIRPGARIGSPPSPPAAETAFAEAEYGPARGIRLLAYADGHAEIKRADGGGGGGWALGGVMVNVEQLALAMCDYLADHDDKAPRASDIRAALKALEPYLEPKLLFLRPGTGNEVVRYVMEPGTRWADISGREAHATPVFVADFGYAFCLVVGADMVARIEVKDTAPAAAPH